MSIQKTSKKFGLAIAALGLCISSVSYAAVIVDPVVTGLHTKYSSDGTTVTPDPAADLATILTGSAAAPGGNVELGKFGSEPATTLTGSVNGHWFTLSSLTLADWTDNGDRLAESYIGDAAGSVGITLDAADLAVAKALFFTADLGFGINPWQRVSDPNIAYVDYLDGTFKVGLQGFFDAGPILQLLFAGIVDPVELIELTTGAQVSEVVKVSYDHKDPAYLYGFFATDTGQSSLDGSFTGNYEVTIPAPASLVLVLVGIAALKRRIA